MEAQNSPQQVSELENHSTSQSDQKPSEAPVVNGNGKKNQLKLVIQITVVLLIISLLSLLYWFLFVHNRVWTDDAYVNGNSVMLMSNQSGIATAIFVDDTDYVEKGQVVVQLDTTTFQLAFDQAQVALALATRQVKQLHEEVEQRKADVALQQANYKKAQEDFENRINIQIPQAISREDLTHARADLDVAHAALNLAIHQLESSIASLGTTPLEHHPTIENAKVSLKQTYINLFRTRILAPVSGFVAQRNVQVGEWITPTRALMSIIPLNHLWIDANFKETQLTDVRLGQPVSITSDLYGSGVVYHGKVDGLSPGTGGVFSLLPPQNASGNWIKIVQRLPVRVYLNPDELKEHPLLIGLSTYVTVDISNSEGKMLSEELSKEPKFETEIFNVPMEPVEKLIQEIIKANLNFNQQTS